MNSKPMDQEMEECCERLCVFEESLEIDFDYELDAPKFFDFTRPETAEEIVEAEMWFRCAQGYPPSPLVVKLISGMEEFDESVTSPSKYGFENAYSVKNVSGCHESADICSLDHAKTGQWVPKSISKGQTQSILPRSSRLLKPTASYLAKQDDQNVGSTRIPGRLQKLRSSLKSHGEIAATKRQKLEIGYLRKVAHLKHQTIFSHKSPKKVLTTNVNYCARPKVTIPKDPYLKTAHRAQRHRSKNAPPGDDYALLQEKTVQVHGFIARPSNKKIFSSKGEFGSFRNHKRETTVPREFKLSRSKKLPTNAPIELFKKLSLNCENQISLLPEQKQPLLKKESKNCCSFMKENKIPSVLTEKPRRCFLKQNQFVGGKAITSIANHPTSARNLLTNCG